MSIQVPQYISIQAGYASNMSSVTVPLNRPGPLKDWERQWLPGDLAVIRFRGVDQLAADTGWTADYANGHGYAWRRLQSGDAPQHTFYFVQFGDHIEWDLLIIYGGSPAPEELKTSAVVLTTGTAPVLPGVGDD